MDDEFVVVANDAAIDECNDAHALLNAHGVPPGQSLVSRLQWLLNRTIIVNFDIEIDTILSDLKAQVAEVSDVSINP